MKISQFIICFVLLALVVFVNLNFGADGVTKIGGLTWLGWASIGLFLVGVGLVFAVGDVARAFSFFDKSDVEANPLPKVRTLTAEELAELGVKKYKGPSFPHPVIFTERCIGCQACVDACPHDVLAIVDGTAAVVGADQCMEDTACQVECPVNPKACIIINTAKTIRARPAPTRDGATYVTNVKGCYIIGDVSGVPLIKNAVKEGAEVIEVIAEDLKNSPDEPKAEYDVAIIGIGPGGASAASVAHDKGLRYVGIEQTKILSTIVSYPKGKYIFFKPDTKDWNGGLSVAGLGLVKGKYDVEPVSESDGIIDDALKAEIEKISIEQAEILRSEMAGKIPSSMQPDFVPLLEEKSKKEINKLFRQYLSEKSDLGSFGGLTREKWRELYEIHFLKLDKAQQEQILSTIRRDIAQNLQHKIPGDQRERILSIWLNGLQEKGVKINEEENCKAVNPAEDGDYFIIQTERGDELKPMTYRVRRVVIAIGLRGSPNKLRLPNEDMKITRNGKEESKVLYSLANPSEYRGKHLILVGGGNSAVESAVDLVAVRDGATITPRSPEDMNTVTLLVRDTLAGNVKFGNKLQLYQCMDDGIISVRFGVGIKEMRENEVVLMNVKTKEEFSPISNDYVFALIGGERPDRFLKSIGITISDS
ncbi:MAG: NAD(P)-binding domain-containing protein [Acidobacteria bacterium]|nr:NAD(P)-binding domain-containing protein [Acidobacteriota bacterium]